MDSSKKKFVIIDAMALTYRAYFAFISRPLKSPSGEPTSAVYGFINQLFKIIEDTKPDYLAVAFDSKEKTFRHEMYDKYKSSRASMPEDMIPQIHRIKEAIDLFNIPVYILPGYEADDLVGAAVKQAEEKGLESFMVTPDKDYIQLVTENTKLIKPGKSAEELDIIDIAKVLELMEFEPVYMIDYLALVGDASDDIPGVAGIGPKSATPLIKEFGTVENIYNNIDKISKKGIQKKLIEFKENAFLSKKLATIVHDVNYDFEFERAKFTNPDFEKLNTLFNELGFKNFPNKLLKVYNSDSENQLPEELTEAETSKVFNKENVVYKLITAKNEARDLANKLLEKDLFVFDTETDSLDLHDLNLAGASFCTEPGIAYFVAVNPFAEISTDLFSPDLSDRLSLTDFVKIFKPVFEKKSIKKVCQNAKYDFAVLRNYNIDVNNLYFDTMLASYLIDADEKHGMDALSEKYLNYTPIPITELIGEKKDAKKIFEADLQKLSDYACEDADITYQLYAVLSNGLEKAGLTKLAEEIEFPLVKVLEDMERTGIKLNTKNLKSFSSDLQILLDNYTAKIYELADTEFNINSPKQLQKILFEDLGLHAAKKTKTGFSTNAQALEALKGDHEIIDIILNYRQAAKLKSTYADALPSLVKHDTGRIHTTYNQTVASTGRLSSLDPNLQNIPIRTDLGKEIRKSFVAKDKDHLIFSADYSQIELRIMASICGDENLTNAFMNGEDIHKSTAAKVFQVNPDEVTPDMRRKAKEVNFGILYGIGPFGLKTRLGILQSHAKEIIETYFETFSKVKNFIDESIVTAQKNEFAETLLKRRRFLPNINSKNRVVRQFEERVAINMPIQGTAADLIKIAMIKVHNELLKRKSKTKMILQVHDELVFDMHKSEIEELTPVIIGLMENAFKLNVPLVVDYGIGKNWLDAH
ncbi:MAG: DNA polymerase I [Melioribacteraceae bacterium]|nr:DNA polymerase I [Melioribacteraceae bacterium]